MVVSQTNIAGTKNSRISFHTSRFWALSTRFSPFL